MYDAIVIGSGAAGVYFSLAYSSKGKKVAIVENMDLGGTAFANGCLPVKKIMDKIKALEKAKQLEKEGLVKIVKNNEYIFNSHGEFSKNIKELITKRLKNANVDIYIGEAEIINRQQIRVNEDLLDCHNIVVASGTSAANLSNSSDIDGRVIFSHKEILNSTDLPRSLTIIGGNVEGIEFASLFSELGVEVQVIEREDEILKGNDRDLIIGIKDRLIKNNVKIHTSKTVKSIEVVEDMAKIKTSDDCFYAQKVLITGIRKPNLPKGLTQNLVELENGYIKVDENLMTSVETVYAIGDINGIHGMAHIAMQQGILLADYLAEGKKISFNYESLPRCIFTINELAGAGYQEHEIENCTVKKFYLKDNFRGMDKSDESFIKIILKDGIIKGYWVSDIDAGTIAGNLGLFMDKKLCIDDIKQSLFINPTISECFLDALIQ